MQLFSRHGKRKGMSAIDRSRAQAHVLLDRAVSGHDVSELLVRWALGVTGDIDPLLGSLMRSDGEMAMIEEMDRRLHNWARWLAGGMSGGLGYGRVSIWNNVRVDCATSAEAVIPTNAVEASETHADVEALPLVLRDTIRLYYTRTQSRAGLAVLLGCAVATVDARLTRAHRVLMDAHMDREEKRRAVREGYERAVKAARP